MCVSQSVSQSVCKTPKQHKINHSTSPTSTKPLTSSHISHTPSHKPSTTTHTTKPHTIISPLPLTHPSTSFNFATFKLFSLFDIMMFLGWKLFHKRSWQTFPWWLWTWSWRLLHRKYPWNLQFFQSWWWWDSNQSYKHCNWWLDGRNNKDSSQWWKTVCLWCFISHFETIQQIVLMFSCFKWYGKVKNKTQRSTRSEEYIWLI